VPEPLLWPAARRDPMGDRADCDLRRLRAVFTPGRGPAKSASAPGRHLAGVVSELCDYRSTTLQSLSIGPPSLALQPSTGKPYPLRRIGLTRPARAPLLLVTMPWRCRHCSRLMLPQPSAGVVPACSGIANGFANYTDPYNLLRIQGSQC
jgi:hypothetical protein